MKLTETIVWWCLKLIDFLCGSRRIFAPSAFSCLLTQRTLRYAENAEKSFKLRHHNRAKNLDIYQPRKYGMRVSQPAEFS